VNVIIEISNNEILLFIATNQNAGIVVVWTVDICCPLLGSPNLQNKCESGSNILTVG
jgi:hypothetical protein